MNTEQHANLMERQGRANRLFEELLSSAPSTREIELEERYPLMPRERVIRLIVNEEFSK